MVFLVIIFICYFVVALIRKTNIQNEWLPIISGVLGFVLGVVAFCTIPSIVPSPTIGITAVYGFFCGLAATGSNQVFKQAVKYIKNKYGISINIPTVEITNNDENTGG